MEAGRIIKGIAIVTQDQPLAERTQPEDGELVQRAKDGDIAAYGALVDRYQRAMYGLVSRMLSRPEDVDDVVQDVFVSAYKAIGRFRGDSAFSTWIHTIAVNTTIRHLRKMKSSRTISIDDPETGMEATLIDDRAPGPSDAMENTERREAVRRAVEQLSEKHRIVVVLHYFQDMSCDEIAKVLNCSVGTVWSRLHYACRKLRGQLDWLEAA